jgi:hypothetical protein
MKPRHLLIAVALLAASPGVHAADTPPGKSGAGRWQIHPIVNGMTTDDKVVNRAQNTILLDTHTGKSWLLWPTKDTPNGYSWIELMQRKDGAKAPQER